MRGLAGREEDARGCSEEVTSEVGDMVALPGLGETPEAKRLTRQTSTEENTLPGGLPRVLGDAAALQHPAVRERQPGAAQNTAREWPVLPTVALSVVAGDGLVMDHVQLGSCQHQSGTCRQKYFTN